MAAPARHEEIIQPPYPGMHINASDMYKYNYAMWSRSGGLTSGTPNLQGLEASVAELNTLIGIDTRGSVQKQLDLKANKVDLGTIASQDADSVAITGGSITGVTISDSDITIEAGTTSNFINLGGTLESNVTAVGNSAGAETTLISYTLGANTLAENLSYLEVTAFGDIAANANNKEIKLKIGTTTLLATGSVAANAGSWEITARIIRENSASEQCTAKIVSSNALITNSATYTNAVEDLTTDLDIFCTGNGIAANDIVQRGLIIKWFKL